MQFLIQLLQVTKTYWNGEIATEALQGIDLNVQRGDFLAIMGPSGCGKSTLLNIIGLLDMPTSGEHWFLGQKMTKLNEKQRAEFRKRNIGFVFQNFNLIDELSVQENVELPLMYLGFSQKERKQKSYQMLEKLKLAHKAKYFPSQLSGGGQQKVAIARALCIEPQILLADEPTGNLDSKNSEEIMQILWQLNQEGVTILMVTHSAQDASYAHHIIDMLDGVIVSRQSLNALRHNLANS
ncbi:ABC transporter ATP-binding protein [Raineya orbicola]|jgi:putative ABC transport system ATP-binding protein|uniref:ABC-type antimicrobial peptide transport system ATPase component n=1 Tax=Raineya orbicola TaxID=2016530 RepID=A0A2N3IE79_9BACT|nr:ABC transporter ATP-binding protein [Raineya orbicola]PKQ68578.1 ABC-type antimicrobial peptide transport system ATPase component [Raineya orbicola]